MPVLAPVRVGSPVLVEVRPSPRTLDSVLRRSWLIVPSMVSDTNGAPPLSIGASSWRDPATGPMAVDSSSCPTLPSGEACVSPVATSPLTGKTFTGLPCSWCRWPNLLLSEGGAAARTPPQRLLSTESMVRRQEAAEVAILTCCCRPREEGTSCFLADPFPARPPSEVPPEPHSPPHDGVLKPWSCSPGNGGGGPLLAYAFSLGHSFDCACLPYSVMWSIQ